MQNILKRYFEAFQNKDEATLASLLTEGVVLEDPFVKRKEGITDVMACYRDIFAKARSLRFKKLNIVEGKEAGAFCEFELEIENGSEPTVVIQGVDIFEFEKNKIAAVRAYLNILR